MPMSDFDTARFSSHAAAVTAMAQRRGWKVPDEHQRFRDIASAAQAIAAEQLTIDQAPAKASDVSRWVDAQAKKRVMHAEQIKVATELAESAEADAIQLVLREIPGNFIPRLCTAFTEAVEAFKALVGTAPHTVTAHTRADDAAAHVRLLASVDALTAHTADRFPLASITGERASLDRSPEWLWLAPDPDTATVHGVSELLTGFTGHQPIDLDGWTRALQTGVSLATYNEAETRRDRFHQARYASGMAPDGGMRDKTLADALALVGARPPRQLAASS